MAARDPLDEALKNVPEELREKVRAALEESFPSPRDFATEHYKTVRRRAALSGAFDPTKLLPTELVDQERQQVLDRLLGESRVTTRKGHRLWMLKEAPRKEVLRDLSMEEIRQELDSGSLASEDGLSRSLTQYLSGSAPPLQEQGVEELAKAAVVSDWLEGTPFESNIPRNVRHHLGLTQLLKPFEELLREGFAGRESELRTLRDCVGVQPPESWAGWGRRGLKSLTQTITGWRSYHPLVVHGAGGIGKSTLMAKFLIEHARQSAERRFPFVYLDFDRATLSPRQPLSLLQEMAQQLTCQFPHLEGALEALAERQRAHFTRLLVEWRKFSQVSKTANLEQVGRDSSLVGDGVRQLREAVRPLTQEGRPFLLVLDTFEEVQRAGDDHVEGVLSLVRALSDEGEWEELRVVISGRAPLVGYKLTDEIALAELDPPSALEFLRRRVPAAPSKLLEEVVSHVGGGPLGLKLAASILRKELESAPEQQRSAQELVGMKRGLLDRIRGLYDSERIAVHLYRRILAHIRDEEVEKLAHPGLILRRLTPELILEVLAEPCGLKDMSPEKARALFERMAQEVSLVTRAGDVLTHRRDIRTSMLSLIRDDLERKSPGTFEKINARAARYYSQRGRPEDRAEELYHHLLRGDIETAEQLWSAEAAPLLGSATDDLPAPARAFLKAMLDQPMDAAEGSLLPLRIWAPYAQRQAEQFLIGGTPRRVLALFSGSARVVEENPVMSRLLGTALAEMGQFKEAIAAHERAYHAITGDMPERLQLIRVYAELLFRLGEPKAEDLFREGAKLALVNPLPMLECLTGQLGAALRARRHDYNEALATEAAITLARSHLRHVKHEAPALLRRLALFTRGYLREFLSAYFQAAPLTSLNAREWRTISSLMRLTPVLTSPQVQKLLQDAKEVEESNIGVFGFEQVDPGDVKLLNELLIELIKHGSPSCVALARELLITRHPEWRMPARFYLLRREQAGNLKLAERFLPPTQLKAFHWMLVEDQARALVDHADESGRLPELLRAATEGKQASAPGDVADTLIHWDEFLNSLVGTERSDPEV